MDKERASQLLWLRAETKAHEARTPLTPGDAARLLRQGFRIVVERSEDRVFPDGDYQSAGCELVAAGSWVAAPEEAFILGIKELPEDETPLGHRHIYFAHAYKEQTGWREILRRFKSGGGRLYDIEYLVDENGQRVVAFSYWAGYAGCAVGVMAWCGQQLGESPPLAHLHPYPDKGEMLDDLREMLAYAENKAGRKPEVFIIGAKGRVGSGAADLARALDLKTICWDKEETARGGPFREILDHDIFINGVLLSKPIPPFVTFDMLQAPARRLSVISDVSCDPNSEHNPLPVYDFCTTFAEPSWRVVEGDTPLDLIAIDHLPTFVPKESSEEFSGQLVEFLAQLDAPDRGVWGGAGEVFEQKIALLD
ncbi:MAG: saccharopine dehydrogenase [Pseudomonadota bacterium]|nr:saccharopine dehydrogenase [Pseudomonadota bacterium]